MVIFLWIGAIYLLIGLIVAGCIACADGVSGVSRENGKIIIDTRAFTYSISFFFLMVFGWLPLVIIDLLDR